MPRGSLGIPGISDIWQPHLLEISVEICSADGLQQQLEREQHSLPAIRAAKMVWLKGPKISKNVKTAITAT